METIFTTTMLLKNLISNLKPEVSTRTINGISFDSRKTKKGDIFVSIRGGKFDGNDFIPQAINRGARIIVHSKHLKKNKKIIYIKVKDTRKFLAKISNKFYKEKPKNLIAVTGTNGKTSVADFFHQIFVIQKKNVGFIGTLGFKKNRYLKKRDLTTLDALTLNHDLNEMKISGVDNVIVEASSHGLKQKRLDFLKIKTGIFTNLSQDHLDYHKNLKDYLNSKLILFKKILKRNSTIITDTDIEQYRTIKKIQKNRNLKIYSIGTQSNIFKILNHKIHENFQTLEIKYNKRIYNLKINLFGSIQIKNLLMAVLAAKTCGLKIDSIFKKISKIRSVDGRLQLVKILPNKSKIFLDYAHTPDGLEKAILSLREHFQKKISIVFGCGGERDKDKRKIMALIAKKYCDKIYITDDNPRNENPQKIRKDILKGLKGSKFLEIGNRKKAITHALKNSSPKEIILIAGKGHETLQDLGKRTIHLSDKKIIKKFKSSQNISNNNVNELKYNSEILKKVLNTNNNYLFSGISINSKKIKNKNIFLAIKGRRNDGHNFINEAIKKGARYCVVSNKIKNKKKMILVKNTFNFLNQFAKNFRNSSMSKFIAITGSSGKTTVKTMLGNLLSKYSSTFFSPHSFNNHFGVPLSISNMRSDHKYGVFEIGMNKPGEILKLSSLVKPHLAAITNISEAHLENFKNTKGIAKAKSEIIHNIQKGGTVILNRDEKFFNYFKSIAEKKGISVKSFGYSEKSNIKFINLKKRRKNFLLKVLVDNQYISLNISNNNNSHVMNILCCLAVLKELNLNFIKIKNIFKDQMPLQGRGKIHRIKKFQKEFFLIDESYNANPSSVKSAIDNFSKIEKKSKRKYFLFGDMLELGQNSHIYHKKISKFINNSDIDKTYVYGAKATETFKFLKNEKRGEIVKNLEIFRKNILKKLRSGDFLMIKGSNATNLHKISKNILGGRL